MTGEPLLSARDIDKRFGGVPVLSGVSLDLAAGRIHALIGPNGAGKTTLLNVVSGYLRQDRGTVSFRGRVIDRWPASRRVQAGLARTFQIVQLFGRMTVEENVLCGFHPHVRQSLLSALAASRAFRTEEAGLRARAAALLDLVGLSPYASRPAGLLPFGLQRRLELARALATGPSLLLLDEPCAGLADAEVDELGLVLRRLAREGTGILVVEHHMEFVMGVAEHVVVLDASELIAAGAPEDVRRNPRVIEAYLGETERALA